jgi:hypothetical protein
MEAAARLCEEMDSASKPFRADKGYQFAAAIRTRAKDAPVDLTRADSLPAAASAQMAEAEYRPATLCEALAILKARHPLSPAEQKDIDEAIHVIMTGDDEPAAVPQGYKLVPLEPTDEMLKAAVSALACNGGDPDYSEGDALDVWNAMTSAAPAALPSEGWRETKEEKPNDGAQCVVHWADGGYALSTYANDVGWWDFSAGACYAEAPSHWMPLPMAPKDST